MTKTLKIAAVAAMLAASASASAWWVGGPWGGYPGSSSWMDDFFGDGYGDFNMSMSGGGHGRGYNRYYGYGYPYYGGYGGGSNVDVQQYTEGTLAIDIYDVAEHDPVWHGVATKRITDKMRRNPDESLTEIVTEILQRFPPIQ